MKQLLVAGALFVGLAAHAQNTGTKKATPTPAKPTAAANSLKNQSDSISYAIGAMVANFYKQQGIRNINSNMIAKAVSDVYSDRKVLLSESECNSIVMLAMNPELKKNIEAGEKFLAENKKKPGVKTSPSGLQYEVLTEGTGSRPTDMDTVTVHYRGTLIDGTEFDNSYSRGQTISFPLKNVIAGWTEGLQYMTVGSKYKFYIPHTLGYGMNTQGPIPGGSVLIFEVELFKVNGKD